MWDYATKLPLQFCVLQGDVVASNCWQFKLSHCLTLVHFNVPPPHVTGQIELFHPLHKEQYFLLHVAKTKQYVLFISGHVYICLWYRFVPVSYIFVEIWNCSDGVVIFVFFCFFLYYSFGWCNLLLGLQEDASWSHGNHFSNSRSVLFKFVLNIGRDLLLCINNI